MLIDPIVTRLDNPEAVHRVLKNLLPPDTKFLLIYQTENGKPTAGYYGLDPKDLSYFIALSNSMLPDM